MKQDKEKEDWFQKLYPHVPKEFPPELRLETGKTYTIIFKEGSPRLVIGGFRRPTAVINVEYQGKPRSLYVGSNVDLARQIRKIEEDKGSLLNLVMEITKIKKQGKNYFFKVAVKEHST